MTKHIHKSENRESPLRIACINIMPKAHEYEAFLQSSLGQPGFRASLTWVRLKTHAYRSTPQSHLVRHYVTFEEAVAAGQLDGLVLTGAPVETLPFPAIRYWPELLEILSFARENIPGTLGLCWGGIALCKFLGMEEAVYDRKLFGVFPGQSSAPGLLSGDETGRFHCPHSRFAGIFEPAVRDAVKSGGIRILASGPETGPFIFESTDKHFLAHLGHPEYPASRLAEEWKRDSEKGRSDVPPPAHFNPEKPENTWKPHTNAFFQYWLATVVKQRTNRENKMVHAIGRGKQ